MSYPEDGIAKNAVSTRQEKHAELSEEVASINNICCQLYNLIARMKGEPRGEQDKVPEHQTPCLIDVLDASPQYIRDKVATCQKLIGEIEELLF